MSIEVAEKTGRKNRIVNHIGTGRTPFETEQLMRAARKFIDNQRIKSGVISFFDTRFDQSRLEEFLDSVSFVQVLDTVTYRFIHHFYQTIGFHKIKDDCFADLVIARIVEPLSKRQTKDFLAARFDKEYPLNRIYQTLKNSFKSDYQDKVEEITYQFIRKHISKNITVLFFDVTTLYFEAFDEDDIRKCGFSKEYRHNQPQIVVALTVTASGMPLAMKMFEGDTFEGHTMIPAISETMDKFSLNDIVVVADAAMLSEDNLKKLEAKQLKYIVGARLGNISNNLFEKIIAALPRKDKACIRLNQENGRTLLVGYSEKRAAKDRHDREKQINKAKDVLVKPQSVVRKYKFIASSGKGQFRLNQKLIEKAEKLEGVKGYITNAIELTDEEIIEKYTELWQVEKSFRMSKSDLKARPIFHTLRESIGTHLLIVFTALVVSRYIEYVTKQSIHVVIKTLTRVKEIVVEDNVTKQRARKLTNLTDEARLLIGYTVFGSLKK